MNWINDNDVTIFRHDDIVKVFKNCFVSFIKLNYCSKFHVNVITGSGDMKIFFYKGFDRKSGIRKYPVWVLPQIRWLGKVRNTNFATNVFNKILLNAAKCKCYSICRFWVIKQKSTQAVGGWGGWGVKFPLTQIRVKKWATCGWIWRQIIRKFSSSKVTSIVSITSSIATLQKNSNKERTKHENVEISTGSENFKEGTKKPARLWYA